MDELRFKLAAEIIRYYRQNPEERALADLILHMMDMSLEEAQGLSIDELAQAIANAVTSNDDVPLPPRGKGRKVRRNSVTKTV